MLGLRTSRESIALVVMLIALSNVFATVFVYYALNLAMQPQPPSITFDYGPGSNKPDNNNNVISVTLGANKTSASITIHPTYQENYYYGVLRIRSNANTNMYLYLVFRGIQNTLPTGSVAKMFIYQGNVKVAEVDLISPPSQINLGAIAPGSTYEVDFYVKIPEGASITNRVYQASITLVYASSADIAPPLNPELGR